MKAGVYARMKQIIGIPRENEAGAKAGELSGKNWICRLYREEGLTVRKRRSGCRAVATRHDKTARNYLAGRCLVPLPRRCHQALDQMGPDPSDQLVRE